MGLPPVRAMTAEDEVAAIAIVALAFAADPVTRWTWPHAHQYLAAMPSFVRAFGGRLSRRRRLLHGRTTGTALWLPPDVHPDEGALGELLENTASPAAREEGPAIFEQMAKYHPTEPHWYLPLVGVDPAHQGKGHGDALMRHALERCDRDKVPAYLESTNPGNLPVPASRLRGRRHDTGRFVSNTGPHVETFTLMQHGCADVLSFSGSLTSENTNFDVLNTASAALFFK